MIQKTTAFLQKNKETKISDGRTLISLKHILKADIDFHEARCPFRLKQFVPNVQQRLIVHVGVGVTMLWFVRQRERSRARKKQKE